MKKLTVLAAALVLTLGLAQCKKEQTPTNNATEGVFITLNVGGGASTSSTADGSRVIVDPDGHQDPDYATVDFEAGDVIYVGNNGSYCGYLEYDGQTNQFAGSVNPTSEADYLHFYFMGNKGGNDEPTSVCITDQMSKYPVISYAHSTALYNAGTTSYSARLLNHCAIVKFTTTDLPQTTDITITGMNNTVAVNFGANNAATSATGDPYTFSSTSNGEITLHAESKTERWAIMLPQGEVATATASAEGYATESAFTVPAIAANDYKAEGIGVELVATAPTTPAGAINGLFSVSATQQVYFSQGNLQYQGSTDTWRFAENQWDYVGNAAGNTAPSDTQAEWIDLFGWGTSGINDYTPIATCWQPWSTSTTNDQYNPYGSTTTNLNSESGKADWGYNAISNGGNQAGDIPGRIAWRTLTKDEWVYLFNSRATGKTVNGTSNARYTEATINTDGNSVNGIILFPDGYSGPTSSTDGITFGTINSSSAWGTKCTSAGWQTLEAAGCVFLPAAGNRNGTSVSNAGSYGYYWSSAFRNSSTAYYLYFRSSFVDRQNYSDRYRGFSVRLACPAE